MITGIGTDIIEVDRVKESMDRHEGFARRVFTAAEQDYCMSRGNPWQHFAGRFAAKEAVAKALGVSLSWLDVEIVPRESGGPEVRLLNAAAAIAGGRRVMVTIAHCKLYATAYAVAVSDQ